jgi:chromosome segregation ATPase
MSQKHPVAAKTKCPITGSDAKCGIDELRAEVQRLTSVVDKWNAAASAEYYTNVAQKLGSVPETLDRVEKLLKSVLAERTEQHEKVRRLEEDVKTIRARLDLLESAPPPAGNGTIRPEG